MIHRGNCHFGSGFNLSVSWRIKQFSANLQAQHGPRHCFPFPPTSRFRFPICFKLNFPPNWRELANRSCDNAPSHLYIIWAPRYCLNKKVLSVTAKPGFICLETLLSGISLIFFFFFALSLFSVKPRNELCLFSYHIKTAITSCYSCNQNTSCF